ncbi:hypothetical protein M9Y10_025892 [Tritrichomonas musculus]|uniref:Intimal thickness related receptor IRP domain-containing protein n=1 Tax=Tritrichomonas musculus TaxID=1915356 RepID=A0ABR2H7Z6_9EUKA
MLLITFLFSITFRQNFTVDAGSGIISLNRRFGLVSGATYSFNFYDANDIDSILVLVATRNDAIDYLNSASDNHICKGKHINYSHVVPIDKNGFGSVSGTIFKKNMYYTVLSPCENDLKYSFQIQYINLNSYLSYDEKPCLISMPIVAGIVCILYVVWLANWFMYFSLKNSLHLYFTIGLTLTTVYYLIFVFEERNRNISDDPSPIYVSRKVFRVLHEAILLSAMLMASEGWCIVRKTITIWGMIGNFIMSAFVTVTLAVYDFADFGTIGTLITLFCLFIVLAVFIIFMMHNIRKARQAVDAHLYVIAEEGINPETTPVFRKLGILRVVVFSVLGYFIALFMRSAFSFIWPLPVWILQLVYDIVTTSFIGVIAFVFRMRKESSKGYISIGDDGEQEPRVFDSEDIQTIDWRSATAEEGANIRSYEEGMQLPAQPYITNKKSTSGNLFADKGKKNNNKDNDEQRNQNLLNDNTEL